MPIGSGIVYNTGDLILNQVSSSGTAFLETKIAAATSSLIYFDSTARINSASLNSITVGTASYVSGSNSIVTNFTASNISASGTGSFGIVGIGTTSPATFLDVVGGNGSYPTSSGTVQATGSIVRLRNGNSNLVLDIGGNGGNGNWLQSTSRIDLSLGYPLLLNPNGGNVGVGTTSPQFLLDVVNTNTTSKLRIGNAGNNFGAQLILAGSNTTKNWVIANQQNLNGTLEFTQTTTTGSSTVDTTPAMVINSSGYVGIGTTSPSTYSSQVAIETSLTRGMMVFNTTLADAGTFYGLGFGYAMSNYNSAYIGFYKAGNANTSNRLFFSLWNQDNILNLTGLGYVGIGTTSPTTKLHITGSHVSGNGMSRFESSDYAIISLKTPSNGDGSDGYWGFRAQDTANNDLMFYGYRYKPTFSGFWVDPSFAGIISKGFFVRNSDGNVGIGTSSPANKLDVLGNISASIISSSRYYSAVPASFVSSFSTTGSISAPGFTFELGSISQSHQPRGFIQVNDYYNSFNNGQNLQLKSFSNGVNYGGWMLMSNWGGTMRIGATGSSAYNANELPPTYMEVGTATVSLVGLTLSGTASWATNATTAQTANALNTANNYTITNLTANNITASSISSSFAYLSNIGFSDQTVTPDTSIFPTGSTSGGFILDGGVYTNGLYRTRFVKIDRSANLSLYIQETKGSSGSFSNLVRFGTHANSPNTFEVFGSTNIQGSITSSNFVGPLIGNTTGTSSWATNALTASFLPVGTYNITSSWAQNVVSASFATTAQTANALNASNTYTVAGLTSAYVDVTGAGTIPTTGIYRPSTKTLGLSADGTLIFKISNVSSPATSSIETGNFVVQSGNVGLGTNSPNNKLDIFGATGTTLNMSNVDDGNRGGKLTFISSSATGRQFYVGTNSSIYNLVFGIDSIEKMRLDTSGNLGIGTTSPSYLLDVSGSTRHGYRAADNHYFTGSVNISGGLSLTNLTASNISASGTGSFGIVGIGTTSPLAALDVRSQAMIGDASIGGVAYQTLSVGGHTRIHGTYRLQFGSANGGYASIGITGTTTGTLTFNTWDGSADRERLRIVNTDGNVGIGTTNPVQKLDVSGSIYINNNASYLYGKTTGGSATRMIGINAVNDFYIGSVDQAVSNIRINNNGSDRVIIDSSGNVGIGTTSPTSLLEISSSTATSLLNIKGSSGNGLLYVSGSGPVGVGTTTFVYAAANRSLIEMYGTTDSVLALRNATANFFLQKTGNDFYFANGGAGTIFFQNNSSTRMVIDSNGNVGIGTSSPAQKLEVQSGSVLIRGDGNALFGTYYASAGENTFFTLHSGSGNTFHIGNDVAGTNYNTMVFTAATDTTGGNVGIGTTSPVAKLQVAGNISGSSFTSSISNAVGFLGTSSWAQNVVSASFATTAQTANALNTGNSYTIAGLTNNGTLSQQGTLSMGSGYQILATTGTVTNPGISFVGDTNAGIYSPTADNIGIVTNGSEKVRIDSSGNVGVGSSSPSSKFEVLTSAVGLANQPNIIGNFRGDTDGRSLIRVDNTSTSAGAAALQAGISFVAYSNVSSQPSANKHEAQIILGSTGANSVTGGQTGTLQIVAPLDIAFNVSASNTIMTGSSYTTFGYNAMYIARSGNVGIGTTGPGSLLEVSSSTASNLINVKGAGGTGLLYVSGSGLVGIGTTSPTQKLYVKSSTGQDGVMIDALQYSELAYRINGSATKSYLALSSIAGGYLVGSTANAFIIRNDTDIFMTADAGVTSNITIKNSGNIGIGTLSPSARLEITGSSNSALLNIKSPISGAIVYVSGSGAVGINTSNIGAYTLQVNGSFAATTKSFVIDHPTKAGKRLIYGSLESPYHGIRLTGRDTIKDGKCKVELPDYMYKLILHDSINIQLTGIKCNKTLYVDEINIPENYFTIAYDKGVFESYKDYDFFWDFTAIRADVPELNTEL